MALKTFICPNCGGAYNPTKYKCEYCGSYVIMSNENFVDLSKITIELKKNAENNYPGVYVFGRLLGQGEKPITLGVANYFTGMASAGGKLLLTNKSLSFSAHGINVGRKEVSISLNDVTNVELGANMLISQHILVSTATEKHKFVVYHGKEWVEKILEAKQHVNDYVEEQEVSQVVQVTADYTVELRKLKELLNDGIITQEEFDIKKRTLLGI